MDGSLLSAPDFGYGVASCLSFLPLLLAFRNQELQTQQSLSGQRPALVNFLSSLRLFTDVNTVH